MEIERDTKIKINSFRFVGERSCFGVQFSIDINKIQFTHKIANSIPVIRGFPGYTPTFICFSKCTIPITRDNSPGGIRFL